MKWVKWKIAISFGIMSAIGLFIVNKCTHNDAVYPNDFRDAVAEDYERNLKSKEFIMPAIDDIDANIPVPKASSAKIKKEAHLTLPEKLEAACKEIAKLSKNRDMRELSKATAYKKIAVLFSKAESVAIGDIKGKWFTGRAFFSDGGQVYGSLLAGMIPGVTAPKSSDGSLDKELIPAVIRSNSPGRFDRISGEEAIAEIGGIVAWDNVSVNEEKTGLVWVYGFRAAAKNIYELRKFGNYFILRIIRDGIPSKYGYYFNPGILPFNYRIEPFEPAADWSDFYRHDRK